MSQELIDKVKVWNNYEIGGFFEEYRWLSNFHPAQISMEHWDRDGESDWLTFPTNEHAFMYAKLEPNADFSRTEYLKIQKMPANKVKQWGRTVKLRSNWEKIKKKVMFDVNWAKYDQHPDLQEKLLETGDKLLIERNYWGDNIWGVDHIKGGANYLGQILMMIRTLLK